MSTATDVIVKPLNRHMDYVLRTLAGRHGAKLMAKLAKQLRDPKIERQIDETWALHQLIIELREIEASGSIEPRHPEARRSRSHCYTTHKDHGTTARYKQISAANTEFEAARPAPNGVRARRKARKHEARSGHPRYKA